MDMQGAGLWPTPTSGDDLLAEMPSDAGFEPQVRARSNTWPLPRPDNYVEPQDDAGSNKCSQHQLSGMGQ